MMETPLIMRHLFEYSQIYYPQKEIVTRTPDGEFRYTYRDFGERTRRLSSALAKLGVERGDRVGTFAWNHHRHLEAYFAIPCMGAVLHTINIRLSPEHITYIVNHAEDKVLLVDEGLLPLLEPLADQLQSVKAFIIMGEGGVQLDGEDAAGSGAGEGGAGGKGRIGAGGSESGASDRARNTPLQPAYSYEALLTEGDPAFSYPDDLEENAPMGMCYTSATTGNPKGVVYSHRGIYLHTMATGLANTMALSESDVIMPIVPMFHANAWGLPFAAVWFGAKMVLPGPAPSPSALLSLIAKEGVTVAAGVPTVWLGLLQEVETHPEQKLALRTVLCGGSAAPPALIQAYEQHGIPFQHAYGMTETSPLATFARLQTYQTALSPEEQLSIRATQGMLVPGLEVRVVKDDEDDEDVAWDGREMGELLLRGPWIADGYYNDERSQDAFRDGWLHTGDVATIDEEGFVRLVDRTKDLVKSGGEWISSVDLENALMAHPAVFEAAVVGVPHPKWDERPLAFVVFKPGQSAAKEELLNSLRSRFAKWWIPDDILIIDEIPKTSVGKFMKRTLREEYQGHYAGV
ncbi:long-chain fatty acid--CoA ligase [Alicyclobacillus ferrooxydans]|uniref:Fatty-acid--CoA ligase n=1 Tax=Alicyclobacillus ferrooxydans TaxID=471514 RepID=A0A0P9D4W8_9BACL|nr:long-chain fatty acid--CoA ligase [Alicyclobacillus ferrooxydans]KPV44482.1 fatty-acid--CoA ligase [Alicyclobacillus ferrooxydans]